MYFVIAQSIQYLAAGIFEPVRHLNVICLVKPCPQFHKYHHFFSVFRCLNQRINDLAPVCDTIQCHFDGYHIRVFRCIIQHFDKRFHALKRIGKQNILFSTCDRILSCMDNAGVSRGLLFS